MIQFLDAGGWVLWLILILNVFLWFLLLERFVFLRRVFPRLLSYFEHDWLQRKDKHSWHSRKVLALVHAQLQDSLNRRLGHIKSMTVIFPLLGLLGTVTGMIEVFSVISYHAGSDPRTMAFGISRATIPTMAGMVSAIVAMLALNSLTVRVRAAKHLVLSRIKTETAVALKL